MKVFGHSGVGKTTLIESLRAGYFSGLFRRSKRSSSSSSGSSVIGSNGKFFKNFICLKNINFKHQLNFHALNFKCKICDTVYTVM